MAFTLFDGSSSFRSKETPLSKGEPVGVSTQVKWKPIEPLGCKSYSNLRRRCSEWTNAGISDTEATMPHHILVPTETSIDSIVALKL